MPAYRSAADDYLELSPYHSASSFSSVHHLATLRSDFVRYRPNPPCRLRVVCVVAGTLSFIGPGLNLQLSQTGYTLK
jgi:hypothetical protein